MLPTLIDRLSDTLAAYEQLILHTSDAQAREDYLRLAAIVRKIISALQSDDVPEAKLLVYAFSRQVSDSLSMQPPEFRALAQVVRDIEKQVI